MAGINRITSASALAALSISVSAVAQQTPAPAPQAEEVDTVIVTGIRESLRKGLENKKEATQVIESIVAEDIGKLPGQQRRRSAAARHRRAGHQPRRRRGRRHHHPRPARHHHHLERPQRIHRLGPQRSRCRTFPPTSSARSTSTRRAPPNSSKPASPARSTCARAGPSTFPASKCRVNARAIQQEQRDTIDPNVSLLVSNQWEVGDEGRFGALLQRELRGHALSRPKRHLPARMVPFATATNPPLGAGAALDACTNTPPDNPNWTPLERIFNTNCRGPWTAALAGGARPRLAPGAGLDAHHQRQSSIPICSRAMHCSPATSRATANVLPRTRAAVRAE